MWNHNVHYHSTILQLVPRNCRRALDVGCGEGLFTRKLSARASEVLGIDLAQEMTELAAQNAPGVGFVCGDFLQRGPQLGSFDFIACLMAIHHMNFASAVRTMQHLLRPGGVLAILGIAVSASGPDYLLDGLGQVMSRAVRLRRKYHEHAAPQAAPTMTYDEVQIAATRLLPNCQFRRRIMFRYTLSWVSE